MAKSFVFKLKPLKKIRRHRLNVAKRDLADLDVRIQRLMTEIQQSQKEIYQLLDEAKTPNAALVKAFSDLISSERVKIKNNEEKLRELEVDRERSRKWVAECAREEKILERLEEKQRSEFNSERDKAEKRRLDSMLAERFARNLLGGGLGE